MTHRRRIARPCWLAIALSALVAAAPLAVMAADAEARMRPVLKIEGDPTTAAPAGAVESDGNATDASTAATGDTAEADDAADSAVDDASTSATDEPDMAIEPEAGVAGANGAVVGAVDADAVDAVGEDAVGEDAAVEPGVAKSGADDAPSEGEASASDPDAAAETANSEGASSEGGDEATDASSSDEAAAGEPASTAPTVVPAVNERVDTDSFVVTRVLMEGVEPRSEYDIDPATVQQVADAALARLAAQEQSLHADEYRRFLDQFRADAMPENLEELFSQFLLSLEEQQLNRGYTLEELATVTAEVENHYRERGLFVTRVFIPPQDVVDGTLTLLVREGRLGDIAVTNNENHHPAAIADTFDHLLTDVIAEAPIEEAIRIVNDHLPGLRVQGLLEAGVNPGETRLVLNVNERNSFRSLLVADNVGGDATGQGRLSVQVEAFDLTDNGDAIAIGATQSKPKDEKFKDGASSGFIDYRFPIDGARTMLQLRGSITDFLIGFGGGIRVDSTTKSVELGVNHVFTRQREFELGGFASAFATNSKQDLLQGNRPLESLSRDQDLWGGVAGITYEWVSPRSETSGFVVTGDTQYRAGRIASGRVRGDRIMPPGGEVQVFRGQQHGYRVAAQSITYYQRNRGAFPFDVVATVRGQYTEDLLPPVARMSLGGSGAVRAFAPDDISVDSGALGRFQLEIPVFDLLIEETESWLGIVRLLTPYTFYDVSYGVLEAQDRNVRTNKDRWVRLDGFGFGLRFNALRGPVGDYGFNFSIDAAWPGEHSDAQIEDIYPTNADNVRIYATMDFLLDKHRTRKLLGWF